LTLTSKTWTKSAGLISTAIALIAHIPAMSPQATTSSETGLSSTLPHQSSPVMELYRSTIPDRVEPEHAT